MERESGEAKEEVRGRKVARVRKIENKREREREKNERENTSARARPVTRNTRHGNSGTIL